MPSFKGGTFFKTHFSSVRSVAASIGSTAFLAPLISTVPFNTWPPSIFILSKSKPFQFRLGLLLFLHYRPIYFLHPAPGRRLLPKPVSRRVSKIQAHVLQSFCKNPARPLRRPAPYAGQKKPQRATCLYQIFLYTAGWTLLYQTFRLYFQT